MPRHPAATVPRSRDDRGTIRSVDHPARLSRLSCFAALVLGACGAEAAPAPPPPPPGPPPTVVVPQLGVGPRPLAFGWVGEGPLVYAVVRDVLSVWDTEADRIVAVAPFDTDSYGTVDVVATERAIRHHASVLSLESGESIDFPVLQGETLAPSFDRSARVEAEPNRELVIRAPGGVETHVPIGEVALAFSPDGRRLATCGAGGVELRETDGARWVAGWQGRADGGCSFLGESLLVAYHDEYVVHTGGSSSATILDARTLQPIGEPLRDAHGVVATRDGARLGMVVDGQLVIVETATHRELARPGVTMRRGLERRGDSVVVDPDTREAVQVSLITGEVLSRGGPIDPATVRSDGARVLLEGEGEHGVLTVRSRDGSTLARLTAPAAAALEVTDAHFVSETFRGLEERDASLVGRVGDRLFTFDDTLEGRPVAACWPPERPRDDSPYGDRAFQGARGAWHQRVVVAEADGSAFVLATGCIGRSADAVEGPFDPIAISADHRSFVSIEAGAIVVRSVEGALRSTLVLDAREEPPCSDSACRLPIELSPDGAHVAIARGPELRLFDAASGLRVARARVAERTRQIAFAPDGTWLVHVGEDGQRTRFEVPSLAVRARWRGVPDLGLRRPVVHPLPDLVVDRNEVRSLDGTLLAGPWAEVSDIADHAIVSGFVVRASYGHVSPWQPGTPRPEIRRTDAARLPGLTPVAPLRGMRIRTTRTDVLSCAEDEDVLTWTRLDGEAPVSRVVEGGCTHGIAALGPHALVLVDVLGARLVRRSDGAVRRVLAVQHGDHVRLVALDGSSEHAGVSFFLRRSAITSDGMIPQPDAAAPPLRDWLLGP